jgi:two-component system alkaline phosphatase synthesis response regulator PhoP
MAHVLVVDDDREICRALRAVLDDAGYQVLCCHDGQSGLDAMRVSTDPLVVLLDQIMPGMDGAEVLHIVAQEPRLAQRHAFVLVTAATQDKRDDLSGLLATLSAPVLTKPFNIDDLLAIIERLDRQLARA